MSSPTKRNQIFWRVGIAMLLLSLLGTWGFAKDGLAPVSAQGELLFHLDGHLTTGKTVAPSYPLFGAQPKEVNVKLAVPGIAGDGSIQLTVTDGAGAEVFIGEILDGETLWATMTLKPGENIFELENTGGEELDYELWIYELDAPTFTWQGVSQGPGTWRSHIQLDFPTSSLYSFDFAVTAGRYQFLMDAEYLQKTVEADGSVQYFVEAGTHDLYLIPDSTAAATTWSLTISGEAAATDTLPYTKSGGELGGGGNDFDQEWLPLKLVTATEANFNLTATGDSADTFAVNLYAGTLATPTHTISDIQGGESVWWTADLAAGLSRIEIIANAANTNALDYALTVNAKPSTGAGDISRTGASAGTSSNNSRLRFSIATAGRYNFTYTAQTGRYQFLVDSDPTIQKTVEANGSVSYYLASGTHELLITQDSAVNTTAWGITIATTGDATDTLPYSKTGGNLGGAANDFTEEWLPLTLAANQEANVRLTLTGALDDGLRAYLYQGAGTTPVYTTPVVYGGETFWWPTELLNGVNHLRLVAANANNGTLAYELQASALSEPPAGWSGIAKGSAGNSTVRVSIPTSGTYHLDLETPVGFGQLLVDGGAAITSDTLLQATSQRAEFDVTLNAGTHDFAVIQSGTAPTTSWELNINSTTAAELLATFTGELQPGETLDPQLPLTGSASRAINFRLIITDVTGAQPLTLTIQDGSGSTVFNKTALDAETVWGTAELQPGQNTFALENGGAETLTYDLRVYETAAAPYSWLGESLGAGDWDSHIKMNFPQTGLYDFDFGLPAGRYQFLVDEQYLQKTVELSGTVGYYIPAGDHTLTIVPDRTTDTSWSLDTGSAGAATDTLPYLKTGGSLESNVFDTEWLPVALNSAEEVNVRLTLTGATDDLLTAYFYAGSDIAPTHTITEIRGGETVWWSLNLPAALSRIRLEAENGNPANLDYELLIQAVPPVAANWAGVSTNAGLNSQVRFTAPTAGLYDFAYDVGAGRYQFKVNSDLALQKTVETSGTVRYYLAAGTHTLTLVQDSESATPQTNWGLDITSAGASYDTLPYAKVGGNLGGPANDFTQELLPLRIAAGQPVNMRLKLTGDMTSALTAYLYNSTSTTPVYTSPLVYGGEAFWDTTTLATDVNRLVLVAQDGNPAALQYDLTIYEINAVNYQLPFTWSGVSKDTGAHSQIRLSTPVTGTYHVTLDIPSGFASIRIADATTTSSVNSWLPQSTRLEFDVPLDAGDHCFTVVQNTSYLSTTWLATVTLKAALPPVITAVTPQTITNNVAHVIHISGSAFQPSLTVTLGSTVLTAVGFQSTNALTATVPAGLPVGPYALTVTNPDGQTDTLATALTLIAGEYKIFLPLIFNNH